jgi:hypothetical protein
MGVGWGHGTGNTIMRMRGGATKMSESTTEGENGWGRELDMCSWMAGFRPQSMQACLQTCIDTC